MSQTFVNRWRVAGLSYFGAHDHLPNISAWWGSSPHAALLHWGRGDRCCRLELVAHRFTSLLALALAGCNGVIGSLSGDPSANGPAAGVGGAGVGGASGGGTNPTDPRLPARAWRLTPAQYNGEVQRAFPGAPQVDLPAGGSERGFTNIAASARIDTGNATQFSESARAIGSWVAKQGATVAHCQTFGTPHCVDKFLGWFPAQAYRRPPTAAEKAELRSVYDDLVGPYGAEWAFSAVVRTILLSAQFLYRTEIGPSGTGVVQMDEYE